MIPVKPLIIFIGLAVAGHAGSLASGSLELAPYVEKALEPSNNAALWDQISGHLHSYIPGVTCNFTTLPSDGQDETIVQIEAQLQNLFPNVHCTGQIEFDTLVAPKTSGLAKRQNPTIDRVERQEVGKINTRVNQFITACYDSPHPGNCRSCMVSTGVLAVAESAVCGSAAYAAAQANHNVASPAIIITLSSCIIAILAQTVLNANGCWTR
ncbi:hypothetical protein BKA63DRAFT_587862 [Paraphoma chrysanthemicola]|nr:hypothetical protein BKA63DRAFT_587862 [Paraphoma chrysanthemicola]